MPLFNVQVRDDFGYSVRHIGAESPLGIAEVVEDFESLQKFVSSISKSISSNILDFSLEALTAACSSSRGTVKPLIGASLVLLITKLTLIHPRVTVRKYATAS